VCCLYVLCASSVYVCLKLMGKLTPLAAVKDWINLKCIITLLTSFYHINLHLVIRKKRIMKSTFHEYLCSYNKYLSF